VGACCGCSWALFFLEFGSARRGRARKVAVQIQGRRIEWRASERVRCASARLSRCRKRRDRSEVEEERLRGTERGVRRRIHSQSLRAGVDCLLKRVKKQRTPDRLGQKDVDAGFHAPLALSFEHVSCVHVDRTTLTTISIRTGQNDDRCSHTSGAHFRGGFVSGQQRHVEVQQNSFESVGAISLGATWTFRRRRSLVQATSLRQCGI